MDFIDLKTQQVGLRDKIDEAIKTVLDHGQYIMGPEVEALEKRLSAYVDCEYAVSCSSGTDALLMSLMALGVGRGDVVVTTPFTFAATAEVITRLGAWIVFVDIDPATFNMDPLGLRWAKELYGPQMKAVIPVNIFGVPADYDTIHEIAGLVPIVEDAAQSFGATYKGTSSGTLGVIGCTSFFPAKPLGGYGDGGACFTNERPLAENIRSLRIHGQGAAPHSHARVGITGRLDSLQAAIINVKMEVFNSELYMRRVIAKRYTTMIEQRPVVEPQKVPDRCRSSYAQYSVLAQDGKHRSKLRTKLSKAQIPTAVYYGTPLHLQKAYQYLGYNRGDCPVAEEIASRIFSLPMHPYLTAEEQERIVNTMVG